MSRVAYGRFLLVCCAFALGVSACSRKSAEEKGVEMATEKLDMAKGIGSALEQKGSDAAESITTGVGNVVKGIGKGVEKSGRTIAVKDSIARAGLKITKVQDASTPTDGTAVHGLEAYVISDADARGKLRVIAYDILDKEIGRAKIDLVSSADDAKYVPIPLDAQVKIDSIVKVEFDFVAEPADVSNANK